MPHIRSMTSKKDCHSEPSFLSSRAIAMDLLIRRRPERSDRQEAYHPE